MDELTSPAAFAGLWRLERSVEQDGYAARFSGKAELAQAGTVWRFEERGHWRRGPMAGLCGTRRYLWRQAGGRIEVLFEDGRPFHDFAPGPGDVEVRHDCAPDLYLGTYRFALPREWALIWRVTGPRKAYRSETTFRRP